MSFSCIKNWSRGWWRWRWLLCPIAGDAFVFDSQCGSFTLDCRPPAYSRMGRSRISIGFIVLLTFRRRAQKKKRLFCYERVAPHLSAAQINPLFLSLWNASPTDAFGRHNYTQRQNLNVAIDLLMSKMLYAAIEAASLPAAICASICFHMDAALSTTQFGCSSSLSQSAMWQERNSIEAVESGTGGNLSSVAPLKQRSLIPFKQVKLEIPTHSLTCTFTGSQIWNPIQIQSLFLDSSLGWCTCRNCLKVFANNQHTG